MAEEQEKEETVIKSLANMFALSFQQVNNSQYSTQYQ